MISHRRSTVAERDHALGVLAEMVAEKRLVLDGLAGQSGGPPGLGPEPALQHEPGGELLQAVQHPAFTTVEYLYRVLPEDSWSAPTVNPRSPIKAPLGAFEVPGQQMFLCMDYEFVALRQSGLDPYDFRQADPYRFSGFMGFDISINGNRRTGQTFFQLDPAPVQLARPTYQPPVGKGVTAAQFNRAGANSFGSVAGEGSALLPVRSNVHGPRNRPFTMVVGGGDKVSLTAVIFRRMTAALAGLQGSVSGYLIHKNTAEALLQRVRPR